MLGVRVSDDELRVDPQRLHEAAATVRGVSDIVGGVKPGGGTEAMGGGLPGSTVGPACVSGSQMAAAAFTALSQVMSGWSAAAHANAATFAGADADNRGRLQSTGASIPGQS